MLSFIRLFCELVFPFLSDVVMTTVKIMPMEFLCKLQIGTAVVKNYKGASTWNTHDLKDIEFNRGKKINVHLFTHSSFCHHMSISVVLGTE